VLQLELVPDRGSVISNSEERGFVEWNAGTGEHVSEFGADMVVISRGVCVVGSRVAAAVSEKGSGTAVAVWDIGTGELKHRADTSDRDPDFVAMVGDVIVVASETYGSVEAWNTTTGTRLFNVTLPSVEITTFEADAWYR
jgi:hypothetical protein